jgi:ABC-2 type transport system permease protein
MTAPSNTPHRTTAAVLRVEVGEGLRAILREPAALFFSVLMPVAFYALFTTIFGRGQDPDAGLPFAATSLATYGTFGVVSVMLLNPGIGVADDRNRGWLRVKMVSATPLPVTLAARVLAALPYALGVVLAISAVSLLITGPVLDLGTWLRLVAVLLVGGLPFALFGLAVGFVASSGSTAAILNAALFPMVLASGLWVPLELMPGFIQAIAPFLPAYHLAELAQAQLTGAPAFGHLLAVLATTAVGAVAAGAAYRNLRS